MSTTSSLAPSAEAHFRSEWLRALVSAEPFNLPPPLPLSPGAVQVATDARTSLGRGEGGALAQHYFTRVERAAQSLGNKRKIWAQIGGHVEQYLKYSRGRLERLFDALDPKQRTFFALIPYFINANAAGIPGYQTNPATPHGLYDCDFNPTVMKAVEQVFGHRTRHTPRQGAAISALLCETDLGTMSKRAAPLIRFWLVLREGVATSGALPLLRAKLDALQEWLKTRALEVSFHLVDIDDLSASQDELVSTHSLPLLRERLYRDAFYLGGQIPLWWASHSGLRAERYAQLRDSLVQSAGAEEGARSPSAARLIQVEVDDKGQVIPLIDLGYLEDPSQGELVDFAFEQLTKSLFNPFEGTLRMALAYAQVGGVPFSYLCERLKKSVFAGEHELEFIDPRFQILDVLQHHFSEGQDRYAQRLFRACVYLDVGVPASRGRLEEREHVVMRAYAQQWGWPQPLLEELDAFGAWPIEKIDALARVTRRFLLDLYRRLSRYAQTNALELQARRDIVRRRRLSACFESMVGKVPHLFTYFLGAPPKEEVLSFIEDPHAPAADRWLLYRGDERERGVSLSAPIATGETLVQLAIWAVFNGCFHPHTVVSVTSDRPEYNIVEGRELLDKLHAMFSGVSAPALPERVFLAPPKVERLLISVSPTSFEEERSSSYASQGWDILNYGQQRRSQLRDISVITQNSWGETFCRRYQGEEAFTQAMRTLYAEGGTRLQLSMPAEVLGPNSRVQPVVRKRVQEILSQATRVFSDEGQEGEAKIFTYEVGGQFQVLYRGTDGARMTTARTLRGVIRRCGRLSPDTQELLIDQLSPSLQEVRALVHRFREDEHAQIYVGWKQTDRLGYVVVCDERERLFFQQSSARETRLAVVRVVRRALPYLKRRVTNTKDLKRALRIFELSEGHIAGGKGLVFTEATGNVLTALTRTGAQGEGLWLVGRFDEGRAGLGLRYGQEEFMASRYGASFVYACVKHIVETKGLTDPETWTLDGSKVTFGPAYGDAGPGAVQHLRLINIYQKAITSALNYILQNQFAAAQ